MNSTIQRDLSERVEFFRSALALLPEKNDQDAGVAYLNIDCENNSEERYCTCNSNQIKTCRHIRALLEIYKGITNVHGKNRFEENFQSSIWYTLFKILVQNNHIQPESVFIESKKDHHPDAIAVMTDKGRELVSYHYVNSDRSRFLERCTIHCDEKNGVSRQEVYKRFRNLALTENERMMANKGHKTRRMAQEESFWYLFSYHCFRELSNKEYTLKTDIRDKTCEYLLICVDKKENTVFEIPVPKEKINEINEKIVKNYLVKESVPIHPIPMTPVLDLRLTDNTEIEILIQYQFVDEDGSISYFSRESLKPYKYGNVFYIEEKKKLVEVLPSYGIVNRFMKNDATVIHEDDIPLFLAQFGEELNQGPHLVDPDIKNIKIINAFDTMFIHPETIKRDWCWLSIAYGKGECSVSLQDILEAANHEERFIKTDNGWIDITSPEMDGFKILYDMPHVQSSLENNGKIKLSRLDLLKLKGNDKYVEQIKNIIEIKPLSKIKSYDGMTSTLRDYQKIGSAVFSVMTWGWVKPIRSWHSCCISKQNNRLTNRFW